MVAVLILIFAFRSSAALGYAYGMAVTGTITITTLLFFYIAHKRWHWPMWLVLVGGGALLVVDLMFFAANLTKLMHGAWLPLLIGILAFTVMTTWQKGRAIVTRARDEAEGPLPGVHRRDRWTSAAAAAHPGPPSSSTGAARPRRWRCGPTSSTTMCCMST